MEEIYKITYTENGLEHTEWIGSYDETISIYNAYLQNTDKINVVMEATIDYPTHPSN
jgi:hypothetical protein